MKFRQLPLLCRSNAETTGKVAPVATIYTKSGNTIHNAKIHFEAPDYIVFSTPTRKSVELPRKFIVSIERNAS